MAKPAFTFTVLFFIIFTSTTISARSLIELETEPSVTDLPQSDAKSALLLPSDNPEVKSTTVVELEPETTTESRDLQADLPVIESQPADRVHPRPFTTVVFRPVNRHFPGKRSYRFRIAGSGCHHGVKGGAKPKLPPRASLKNQVLGHGREISLENDMILTTGEGREFVPEMVEQRQIFPGRVVRINSHRHHNHHRGNGGEMRRFPFSKHGHEMFVKQSSRKPFEEKREDAGGIVKSIRKFLYHF